MGSISSQISAGVCPLGMQGVPLKISAGLTYSSFVAATIAWGGAGNGRGALNGQICGPIDWQGASHNVC